ncbi:hypothetical protein ACHAPO_002420 [Fusarium lateritium]
MELTQQLQYEERRNAMDKSHRESLTFFQQDSNEDCYLEDILDPDDSDSDAPREWVTEESIVVHTGTKRAKVTIKPKVTSLPPSVVRLAQNALHAIVLFKCSTLDDEHDEKRALAGQVLMSIAEHRSECNKYELDEYDTMAAVDSLTIDVAKEPMIHKTSEFPRLAGLLDSKHQNGENEKTTKKKRKLRGMVDYIREANQKS